MKRNLFDEINEGFDALMEERQGKLSLKTHEVEIKSMPDSDRGLPSLDDGFRHPCRNDEHYSSLILRHY
jgi:hypothetical protein